MHQDRECWPLFPIILFPSLMIDSSGVEMFAPVISGTQTPRSLRRAGKSSFFFMSSLFSPSKVWTEGEELHRSCPTWRAGEIIFVWNKSNFSWGFCELPPPRGEWLRRAIPVSLPRQCFHWGGHFHAAEWLTAEQSCWKSEPWHLLEWPVLSQSQGNVLLCRFTAPASGDYH